MFIKRADVKIAEILDDGEKFDEESIKKAIEKIKQEKKSESEEKQLKKNIAEAGNKIELNTESN